MKGVKRRHPDLATVEDRRLFSGLGGPATSCEERWANRAGRQSARGVGGMEMPTVGVGHRRPAPIASTARRKEIIGTAFQVCRAVALVVLKGERLSQFVLNRKR